MNIYMKLRRPNLRRPFRAFGNLALNPGLAPWAFLLDPFGVRTFVTETSEQRHAGRGDRGCLR